jgi:hypothetical protein
LLLLRIVFAEFDASEFVEGALHRCQEIAECVCVSDVGAVEGDEGMSTLDDLDELAAGGIVTHDVAVPFCAKREEKNRRASLLDSVRERQAHFGVAGLKARFYATLGKVCKQFMVGR